MTLEVVHGGFATGNTAAAGPLQPHEIKKLGSVAQPGQAADCGALNLYFLSDLGHPELAAISSLKRSTEIYLPFRPWGPASCGEDPMVSLS